MTRARWIWFVLIGLYAAFFSGYTSFEGPLTDEEIAHYIALAESRVPAPPPERVANSAMDLMNAEGMEEWTRGAGMRYRSRRDMLEIATNPAFAGSHEFKIADMGKTIAFPIDPWIQLGDPRLVLVLLFAAIGCGLSWGEALRQSRGA
jgi:hypothetical protein